MPFRTRCAVILWLLLAAVLSAKAEPIALHTVPVSARSYRLLAMSMDDEGFIWCGSIHRVVHRYDPRAGKIETFPLPYDANVSACICVGKKVYMLGQTYPHLMIYDRASKRFSEVDYPSPKADVWYGTATVDGRHFYLFDRASSGVIRWDTQTESGSAIPYPYQGPLPGTGRHVAADRALWCSIHDFSAGQYVPLGIARLDLVLNEFSGYYPFPKDDSATAAYEDPERTLFFPDTLKGKLVPFDFRTKRWCKPIPVPRFGKLFGFIGLGTVHHGRWYFSLSTYNGTELGCDGAPYHFCNALLEFDPVARTFEFPTLNTEKAYYQIAYTLSAREQFYATGSNIRQPDGSLDQRQQGEIIFWQTKEPDQKK